MVGQIKVIGMATKKKKKSKIVKVICARQTFVGDFVEDTDTQIVIKVDSLYATIYKAHIVAIQSGFPDE